jgi:hypothetical protein
MGQDRSLPSLVIHALNPARDDQIADAMPLAARYTFVVVN